MDVQVPVGTKFDPSAGVKVWGQKNLGSFVDLVMYEPSILKDGKLRPAILWILELKKNQSGTTSNTNSLFSRTSNVFSRPFQFMPFEGPHSQAQMQACLCGALVNLNYNLLSKNLVIKSAVLRVHSGGVGLTEIPCQWSRKVAKLLASSLLA